MSEPGGHYFAEEPGVASAPDVVDLGLPDVHLRLATDRGVFSHGRIDAGTKLLLLRVPPPPAGDLLDLGCGAGPIALTMAHRSPEATVWAVDVNSRARALCAANASANALDNVRVAEPDEVPSAVRFAAIWSNPPIRIGKAALHDLLRRWLGRLAPGGEAHLVVHKHLGADSLQRWLNEDGHAAERIASSAGYRILRVG